MLPAQMVVEELLLSALEPGVERPSTSTLGDDSLCGGATTSTINGTGRPPGGNTPGCSHILPPSDGGGYDSHSGNDDTRDGNTRTGNKGHDSTNAIEGKTSGSKQCQTLTSEIDPHFLKTDVIEEKESCYLSPHDVTNSVCSAYSDGVGIHHCPLATSNSNSSLCNLYAISDGESTILENTDNSFSYNNYTNGCGFGAPTSSNLVNKEKEFHESDQIVKEIDGRQFEKIQGNILKVNYVVNEPHSRSDNASVSDNITVCDTNKLGSYDTTTNDGAKEVTCKTSDVIRSDKVTRNISVNTGECSHQVGFLRKLDPDINSQSVTKSESGLEKETKLSETPTASHVPAGVDTAPCSVPTLICDSDLRYNSANTIRNNCVDGDESFVTDRRSNCCAVDADKNISCDEDTIIDSGEDATNGGDSDGSQSFSSISPSCSEYVRDEVVASMDTEEYDHVACPLLAYNIAVNSSSVKDASVSSSNNNFVCGDEIRKLSSGAVSTVSSNYSFTSDDDIAIIGIDNSYYQHDCPFNDESNLYSFSNPNFGARIMLAKEGINNFPLSVSSDSEEHRIFGGVSTTAYFNSPNSPLSVSRRNISVIERPRTVSSQTSDSSCTIISGGECHATRQTSTSNPFLLDEAGIEEQCITGLAGDCVVKEDVSKTHALRKSALMRSSIRSVSESIPVSTSNYTSQKNVLRHSGSFDSSSLVERKVQLERINAASKTPMKSRISATSFRSNSALGTNSEMVAQFEDSSSELYPCYVLDFMRPKFIVQDRVSDIKILEKKPCQLYVTVEVLVQRTQHPECEVEVRLQYLISRLISYIFKLNI